MKLKRLSWLVVGLVVLSLLASAWKNWVTTADTTRGNRMFQTTTDAGPETRPSKAKKTVWTLAP